MGSIENFRGNATQAEDNCALRLVADAGLAQSRPQAQQPGDFFYNQSSTQSHDLDLNLGSGFPRLTDRAIMPATALLSSGTRGWMSELGNQRDLNRLLSESWRPQWAQTTAGELPSLRHELGKLAEPRAAEQSIMHDIGARGIKRGLATAGCAIAGSLAMDMTRYRDTSYGTASKLADSLGVAAAGYGLIPGLKGSIGRGIGMFAAHVVGREIDKWLDERNKNA